MNNRMKNYMKEHAFSLCLLGTSLLFYLFFAWYDGVVICADSASYINMSVTREAFYPSLLAISRFLFGEGDLYLFMIVLLQSVVAAVSAWILEEYLRKEMAVPKWMSVCLLAFPLMVSLLCRFAALRSSMYSNSIMTEGLAVALFLIVIREVLEFLLYQTRRSLFLASALSALLITTRKQMYVTLALIALAILTVAFFNKSNAKQWGRTIIKVAIVSALILLSSMVYDRAYNYLVRGEVAGHSSDNRFVLTMVFYTAEEADADYIEDPEIRQLFLDIYHTCKESGFLGQSAGEGWYNEVTHFGDNYDFIQIDTMWPMIHDYVDEKNPEWADVPNSIERETETDRISKVMIDAILPHDYPRILHALFNNFLSGLVTTVAQRKPILILYSILAYLGYLGVLAYNLKVNKLSKTNIFAILTLVAIVVNVGVVSAVIFCQTRYTLYNMPLFYMAGVLLLLELYRTKGVKNGLV